MSEELKETKSTKVMKWVMIGIFTVAFVLGIAAVVFTEGNEPAYNEQQTAPSQSNSW